MSCLTLPSPHSWPIDILRDKGLMGIVEFVTGVLIGGRVIAIRVLAEIEIPNPNALTFSLAKAAPRSSTLEAAHFNS